LNNNENITVEVAYALPTKQLIIPVQVPAHSTVEAAVTTSGILQKFPEIDLTAQQVGIFGKLTKLDAPLRHLDRVEIYRPLIADPKEIRKQRAKEGKTMG
jgi:uncharacterized protein